MTQGNSTVPAGITLDQPATPSAPASTSSVPAGITLDTPHPQANAQQQEPDDIAQAGQDAVEAGAAGAGELMNGASKLGLKIPGIEALSQSAGNLVGKVAKSAGFKDFGEGMLGTTVQQGQKASEAHAKQMKDEATDSIAGKAGYAGESLLEFLLPEAALGKALDAQKVLQAGNVMKILEKFPPLVEAIKAGASLNKAKAFLSPEELKLIQANPYLGRLVNAGLNSLRAAAAQGTATTVRTGGDVKEGIEEGLKMGAITVPFGAAGAAVGGTLSKAGDAAKTVEELGNVAKQAPAETSLAGDLGTSITQKQAGVDSALESATGNAEQGLETESTDAEAAKTASTADATKELENRTIAAHEGQRALETQAEDKLATGTKQTEEQLATTKEAAHKTLIGTLTKASEGAPDKAEMAETVSNGINQAEEASHQKYEAGISGEDGIETRLDGHETEVKDSPVAEQSGKLLQNPVPEDHPAVAMGKTAVGDKLDGNVKTLLQGLRDGEVTTVGEDGEKVTKTWKPFTVHDLVQLRQVVRKMASSYTLGDVNARVLRNLIPSIDDTIGKLAEEAGDEGVLHDYESLRSEYAQSRKLLDSNTADKLMLNKPDKALDDVGKYLMSGSNPSAKITTLRNIIGEEAMQAVAKSKAQQYLAMAEEQPEKFVKEWAKVPDDVKVNFFGTDMAQQIDEAAKGYSGTTSAAEESSQAALDAAKTEHKASMSAAKNVGSAYTQTAKKAHKEVMAQVESKYQDAVDAAKQAYDDAIANAKGAHATASEPFKGAFMKQLAEGRVNEALLKGQVDIQDIKGVKGVVGPEKWTDIANGIFQRAIANAKDAGGNFDAEELVDWWKSMKPEVRQEMFGNLEKQQAADGSDLLTSQLTRIEGTIKDAKQAATWKRIFKTGAHTGTVAALGAFGHGLGGMLGMILTSGGEIGTQWASKDARATINWIANHPNVWKSVEKLDNAAGSKAADKTLKALYGGVSASMR